MAADLHPIVEMDTGYFFGGSADGKWIKAEKAAKSMKGRTRLSRFWAHRGDWQSHGRQTEVCRRGVCGHAEGVAFVKAEGRRDRAERALERPAAKSRASLTQPSRSISMRFANS